eukprot:14477636-Alexandrium_andersonii.AAC.1
MQGHAFKAHGLALQGRPRSARPRIPGSNACPPNACTPALRDARARTKGQHLCTSSHNGPGTC